MSHSAETSRRSPPGSASGSEPRSAPRLPFAFARDHQVVLEGNRLIAGPGATATGLREAQRRAAARAWTPALDQVDQATFETTLTRFYQGNDDNPHDDTLVFDLDETSAPSGQSPARQRDLLEEADDAPVIRLVNGLLRQAVQAGASDLHVEPHEGGLRVRMRVDGFLQPLMDRADVPVRRVVSRLKVMAGLDIAETRLPQDGRIPLSFGGRVIDTRVSSLPGQYGERVVLRILDRQSGLMPLAELGLSADQQALLERLSALPNGIILATGPTGSGKTTTLYSLLQLANRHERNIVTVEDPIEYDLPGISQSQINAEIGMTFAAGLRATLRQDPDVILVGEIRDTETAQVAAQASLTGHLVFSSLHANGSVAAVTRLRDLGLDNFLIAATLRGILAQRLLRCLCAECKDFVAPNAAAQGLYASLGQETPAKVAHAVGCDACGDTGYSGRQGVFEIVEITEAVAAAIGENASEQDLKRLAVPKGTSLLAQGLHLVADGRTSVEEVRRVLGDQ